MIKIISGILLIFSFAISYSQPLENKDLEIISKAIKNKKIIGLGEPEHFFTGYYDVKIQIIKHLVLQNKIDAIALEGSGIESRKLDDYIKGSEVDLYTVLPNLNAGYKYEQSGIFDCKEILDFLQWLRTENKSRKNKISIFGIDFQNIETPVKNLKSRFPNSISLHKHLDTIRNNLYSLIKRFSDDASQGEIPKIYFDSLWKDKAKHTYDLSEKVLNYVNTKDTHTLISQNARELNQYTYIFVDPNMNRDSIMYKNFIMYYDPNKTTLLWAAYLHIANDFLVSKNGKILLLGAYLNKNFGDKYFKISLVGLDNPQPANRILFPIPPTSKKYEKLDLLVKTKPGPGAIRLVDQKVKNEQNK